MYDTTFNCKKATERAKLSIMNNKAVASASALNFYAVFCFFSVLPFVFTLPHGDILQRQRRLSTIRVDLVPGPHWVWGNLLFTFTVSPLTVLVDMTLRHHMSIRRNMLQERYVSSPKHIPIGSYFLLSVIFRSTVIRDSRCYARKLSPLDIGLSHIHKGYPI